MKKTIKKYIEKNTFLKSLYYFLKNRDNQKYVEWVNDFNQPYMLKIQNKGKENPDKIIYLVEFQDNNLGFFGLWKQCIERLSYADYFGFTPVVYWGENNLYFEQSLNCNAFENYFEQTSEIAYTSAENSKKLIQCRGAIDNAGLFDNRSYALDEKEIEKYIYYQKKYITIKPELEQKILQEYNGLIKAKKTLAVHIRGVEWGNIANHPIPIGLDEYTKVIDKAINEFEFELIFLATDSDDTLQEMKRIYNDKIVYYDDVARASEGSHTLAIFDEKNNAPMKHYDMGYEVLRDMMSLSMADGLIAGYSNISLASIVWKKTQNKEYEFSHIMKQKINQHGMSVSKATKKMREGKY